MSGSEINNRSIKNQAQTLSNKDSQTPSHVRKRSGNPNPSGF